MKAKIFAYALSAMLFVLCSSVHAQQAAKIPRIGYLSSVSASAASFRTEPLRRGLRELGYGEGKNIVIEQRYAEGTFDRLPALAAELVDIIITTGPAPTRAATRATVT